MVRGLFLVQNIAILMTSSMIKDRSYQHLYNRKWRRMSKAFKVRHPLCVYCLQVGKTTAVEGRLGVVDHIVPHNGDLKLFWNELNWQSLCNACHDGPKRIEEARGYAIGCDVNGMPIGVHPWNEE